MKHNYSAEDILLYLYDECSVVKKLAMAKAIEEDKELRSDFKLMLEQKKRLDQLTMQAPQPVVDLILYESREALIPILS